MGDVTNLIYNGDFSKGTDSWSGNGITTSNGVVTLTGELVQNVYVPVANNRRYRLSYDIKFNTPDGSHMFYIALRTYDSKRIHISYVEQSLRANSVTTLAADLKSGDSTALLTSATGWSATGYIGVFDLRAYGTKRSSKWIQYTNISGTTVTLKNAYSGTTIPSGTTIGSQFASSTYFYPHSIASNKLPTDWTTYTVEFNGGDSMRYSCKYFIFSTLGYSHNYSMRNIRLECVSDYQECPVRDYKISPSFYKTGIVQAPFFNEVGMDIRYIRDTINGNTVNSNNHWNEIQVFNSVGENIALAKNVKVGTTTWSNGYVTDGIIDSHWNSNNNSNTQPTLVLDLGFVDRVNSIKIWHYYPDGRTYYNNVTEVSVDGETWFTVYKGQKPETSAGNEIILSPALMSIYNSGDIYANEFIEW